MASRGVRHLNGRQCFNQPAHGKRRRRVQSALRGGGGRWEGVVRTEETVGQRLSRSDPLLGVVPQQLVEQVDAIWVYVRSVV